MQDDWFTPSEPEPWIKELLRDVKRPSVFAGNAFYWMAAAAFALFQALAAPIFWALSGSFPISAGGYRVAIEILLYLGVLFLPPLVYAMTHEGMRESFRLNPVSPGRAVCAALAAGFGFLTVNFVTVLWMILLEALGADVSAAPEVLSGNLTLDILIVAVLPGVCEEMMFRGMLLATYERWGTWKAIWLTSLLFAGLHGSVTGFPAELTLGVALGFTAVSANSIYPAMMLHTLYNAIALIVAYRQPAEAAETAGTLIQQLGGVSGVIGAAALGIFFFFGLLAALRAMDALRVRDGERFGNDRVIVKKRMDRGEVILLCSALCTVGWFYIQDILRLCGR